MSAPLGGSAENDPRIGTVLQGRYLILGRIDEGSMGSVYRAERVQLGRQVAIKFLHTPLARDPHLRARFEIEARAMGKLAHPNCVAVTDCGVADAPYVVMDLVVGPTLREVMTGPLPAARALRITRQLLAALAHAHRHGIVHRDIKPENVLLEQAAGLDDHVRVLDFGLAKLRGSDQALTAGFAIGTPNYMAPEQTTGDAPADERADLYAAGIVLFEMLTGKKPFEGKDVGEIILRHQRPARPLLRAAFPAGGFSAELEALVTRAMARAPEARFASAVEMTAALDEVPEARGTARASDADTTIKDPTRMFTAVAPAVPAAIPSTEFPSARAGAWLGRRVRWVRQSRGRTIGVVAAAAVVVVGAAAFALRGGSPPVVRAPVPAAAPAAARGKAPAKATARPEEPSTEKASEKPAAPAADADEALAGRDTTLAALRERRRAEPRNAAVAADLARLYYEKRWWTAGVESYRAAVHLDRALKNDQPLIAHTITALGNDRAQREAEELLRTLGPTARTAVKSAAKEHPSARVRERAAALYKRWTCRSFFCF